MGLGVAQAEAQWVCPALPQGHCSLQGLPGQGLPSVFHSLSGWTSGFGS